MNRLTRGIGFLIVAITLVGALDSYGFKPPAREPLPNVDNRSALAVAAPLGAQAPALALSANDVRRRFPDVIVDQDGMGRAKFVRAQSGFLTGPDGAGGKVSANVVSAIPVGDPDRGLKAFLQDNAALFGHGPEALAMARITREYVGPKNGMRSVTWQQQVDGVPVFEALLTAHTTKRGELVNVADQFLSNPVGAAEAGTPTRAAALAGLGVTAEQAVQAAAAAVGVTLKAGDVSALGPRAALPDRVQLFSAAGLVGETRASLVWLPVSQASLRLCWDVILTSRERGEMFRVLIDATTGETWLRRCLTVYATDASFRVFTSDSPSPYSPGLSSPGSYQPPLVARDLVTFTALSTNASPNGWINDGGNTTLGNNVDAHLDRNDDNVADPGSRPAGSPARVFDFPMDLTNQAPSAYLNASVVQLFYLNNWMHDRLYELGFTEAAGNFQNDTFGRGGIGGDAILADAQDGALLNDGYHVNNANMSTPPDGAPPRMQMYVFDGPNPDRDGDLDAEIVLHEYAHGLSNRRVGGGAGISALQTAGMGEGWSDFYALALLSETGDNPNGCYPTGGYATYQLSGLTQNYYYGIRRYPYSTAMSKNPLTFKDIDPAQADPHTGVSTSPIFGGGDADEVHNMGEVWCVALWEARANLVGKYGGEIGNELMLQLVTDAMGLCPVNPNFLQSRDAILQADEVNTGGANYRELWAAFAKRGMGAGATSPDAATTEGLRESYNIPDALWVVPMSGWEVSGYLGGPFSPTSCVLVLKNKGDDSLTWSASTRAGWLSLSRAGGVLASGGSNTVTLFLNNAANSLAEGSYAEIVNFSNATSRVNQPLTVSLTVKPIPGKIRIRDTILPATDTNLPYGTVALGMTRTERITVNNIDLSHDLLISGLGFGYYREDFNDGLAQSWVPDSATYWTVINGQYRAKMATSAREMQSTFTGEKWADCDARVTMSRTGDEINEQMLALRASDSFSFQSSRGSAYLVGITTIGYYFVGKVINGKFSFLQYWTWSPYLTEWDNEVEVNLRGNMIEVYINGELETSGTDDSIPGPGHMVLLGYTEKDYQTVHYFDDITVGPSLPGGSLSRLEMGSETEPWPYGDGDPSSKLTEWKADDSSGGTPQAVLAGLISKISGPFRISNIPDMPIRLVPGAGFTFDVSYQPASTDPDQNTVLIFSNDADTPELAIPVSGKGGTSPLNVSPSTWLSVRGGIGGPFSPSGTVYTVTNGGEAVLSWTAAKDFSWVTVEPMSGTLAAGGSASVTVTVNSAATDLPEGVYSNAITFNNPVVWGPRTRGVLLIIGRYPRLELTPLFFGVTNIVGSKSLRKLTVGNSGDSNLVWGLRLPNDRFQDDCEGGAAKWTHFGATDKWHISTNRSVSGSNSWYCGTDTTRQYANNLNNSLSSAPMLLRAGAMLTFSHWYAFEAGYDFGYVEISTNNGIAFASLAAFTGTNGVWKTEAFDLSAYAGKSATFRFRFKSDNMNVFEGWYVDDISVAPIAVPDGNVVTASTIEGILPPGAVTNVMITFDSVGMINGAVRSGELAMACNDPNATYKTLPFLIRIVPPMAMTIPGSAKEGDGLLPGAGRLSLQDSLPGNLIINLVSSDPEEVMVPDTVTIPAGQTNAVFDLTIQDDRRVDGSQPITISALSDYYGSQVITVADNENTNLTLKLPVIGYEGEVYTNGGRVMLDGSWPDALTVNLASSDTTEVVVPAQVTIPAGATSAAFTITFPVDGISDRIQTSRVTAVAANFASASAFIKTQDRDVHHFDIGTVSSPKSAGTPFLFTVTAKNIQGETITAYGENMRLNATGSGGAVAMQPTNAPFVDGVWTGMACVNKPDLNVRITVGAGLVYAGRSNPFEVKLGALDHFVWSNFSSPQNVNYAFPVTLTAQDAANNTVIGFTGTASLSALTGGWATTNVVGESGFVLTNASFRTAGIRFTPARPLFVTHLRRFWGNRVSLWTDNGVLLATRTFSGADGVWLESALETPISLLAGTTYRLAAYTPGPSCYLREDGMPASFTDGTVVGGCLSDAGDVFPDAACPAPFLADLRYASDVSQTVSMAPLKTGNFVKGKWTGTVTVKAKATNMCLRADSGGRSGISRVFDVGALSLTLQVPTVAWEGDATLVNAGTVKLTRARSTNAYVTLVSGDTTELKVASRILIPAGKTSVRFNLTIVDDGIDDGPQTVQATASLAGYVPATGTIEIRPAIVKNPVLTPAGGKFDGSRLVVMTCATAGAQIRYTTGGAEVTETSTLYTTAVTLTESCVLKAKAFRATAVPSETVVGDFMKVVATAVVNQEELTDLGASASEKRYFKIEIPVLATNLQFSISGGAGECDLIVRYAEIPETNAYDYYPALTGNVETVTVVAPAAGVWYALLLAGPEGFEGVRLLVTYSIQPPPVTPPLITPAGGTKIGSILVYMTNTTPGATIRYTLDGSAPTTNSAVYTSPVKLDPTPLKTVKARAMKAGRFDSTVATVVYKIATPLTSGKPLVLSDKKNGISYYAIRVPAGKTKLNCLLMVGSGDGNLYVRKNLLPSLTVYDACSVMANNNEMINIWYPQAGKWYFIMVYGKTAYSQAVFQASLQ